MSHNHSQKSLDRLITEVLLSTLVVVGKQTAILYFAHNSEKRT